jgi:phage gp29-like protein
VPLLRTLTDWDIDAVLAAVDAHERGEFQQSGLLWLWMQRDPRLKTVLDVRTGGLPALPFTVDAATATPSSEELALAALLEDRWFDLFPESTIRALLKTAIGMGVAVARVEWASDERGHWWPRLVVWPGDEVRWDDPSSVYRVQTRQESEVPVVPGNGWLLWEPHGARSFQAGAVISLALPCLITSFDWRDWVNYNDAYGRPIRKAIVPRGATTAAKDDFFDNLDELGRAESTILCEQNLDGSGFNFEFVTPGGPTIDTFEKSIAQADKDKSTVILGQTLSTDVASSGSLALGDVHKEIKAEKIRADANGLATVLREQILKPWAAYNFGLRDAAPWPRWKTDPTPQEKEEKKEATP